MTLGWALLALIYLGGLFWIGRWGDSNSTLAKRLTSHPATYSLALAIYCTAWTFFGAVGEASRDNWQYLPILLGPILVYVIGFRFVRKLTQVSKKQNITTIADFISSRYGKRQPVALFVTIIALLATIPYIALQLKAIGAAFSRVAEQPNNQWVVFVATILIALFSIYFGTRRADVTEYRRGLMLAIAFESLVKLTALLLIGIIAWFWYSQGDYEPIMSSYTTQSAIEGLYSFPFIAQTIVAAAAIICLPRQFHVAVVDNLNIEHLKTARWLFPLYLVLMAIAIPVIATAGNAILGSSDATPDTYVLDLAILSDSLFLQFIVFVGGLSAATAMIIVATLTLSTMVTNDVILPKLIALSDNDANAGEYARKILPIRRIVIAALLMLAFLYQQQMAGSRSLASIGMIAFSLVVQLLPAIVFGLYWKKGHAHGVYAGLLAGIFTWVLWLMLPLFSDSTTLSLQTDTITQGAIISLVANTLAFILFSYFAPPRLVDRIQAQAFVSPREAAVSQPKTSTRATVEDLLTLMSTFLGEARCKDLINSFARQNEHPLEMENRPSEAFISFCERALGGVLGASSAKALVDSVLSGKKLDFEEVVNFFDDTTQALKFNTSALFTSIESLEQGISVVDKNLELVAWNKRYLELFDYPDEMIAVGTPLEKLVRFNAERGECGLGDIDTLVNKRLEHIRLGHSHRFVRQRSDGKMIEMVGNPLPGGGFVTSFNDITTHIELQKALQESNIDLEKRVQKRGEEVQAINAELRSEITRRAELEEELVSARKLAEEANASKTRFLALASHDILQPLNAAKLYLSALDETGLSNDATDIVGKLSDSVNASEALIATLLDIARIDQGDMQPNFNTLSMPRLLTPLVDEFTMKAGQKGLVLKTHIQDVSVSSDKTYLYRIIQNLLSNAVKYTEHGKILLSVRKRGAEVLIQVWDTGMGVSEKDQKSIFADFYRVDGMTEHGVGLGLGVVARLSQQLNSNVTIRSVAKQGSCFSIRLPLAKQETPTSGSATRKVSNLAGLKVLCVDDQRENLDAMQTLLTKWKAEVFLASDTATALTISAENIPDVVLMDFQLGADENGLDAISRLRESVSEDLVAVLVTANKEDELVARCEQMGVHYLPKPVKPAKLRALLQRYQTKA